MENEKEKQETTTGTSSDAIKVDIKSGGSIKAEPATATTGNPPGTPSTTVKIDGIKEVPFDPRYWTKRISEFCGEQEGKNEEAWLAAKAHIDTALVKMNQILK